MQYTTIHVARSDGVVYTTEEINNASSAMPVAGPLDDSDAKVRNFKVSLGRLLRFNLGRPDDSKSFLFLDSACFYRRGEVSSEADD